MIMTTTGTVQGQTIKQYHGIVVGEAVMGMNIFKDLFASVRDIVGGRSGAYEKEMSRARAIALQELQERARELGANGVIGIDLDYEAVGQGGSMLMITACGTAVTLGA
jgi:uncharacterized protein YbjQ (UPF0145 family)